MHDEQVWVGVAGRMFVEEKDIIDRSAIGVSAVECGNPACVSRCREVAVFVCGPNGMAFSYRFAPEAALELGRHMMDRASAQIVEAAAGRTRQ